jgi:SAM-dependent methyltransferase
MGIGFDLVARVNASAHHAGVVAAVDQFDNLATHSQYRVPYRLTARYLSRGDVVLDWGCGNGHFSMLLELLGARVTGYSFEPSPATMATSGSFTHVRGADADPRSIPFPSATFDCVCSVGVLEHVWETGGDEPSSLREIARILKPDGTFLTFHLPNRFGWVEPVFRVVRKNWHFHQRRYDAARIRVLWEAAGLDVIDIGTYNFLPRNHIRFLPAFLRRSVLFARVYDRLDAAFSLVLAPLCTNFYVVGRKRA